MKKFLSVLMAAILLIFSVSISACVSTTSETGDRDWIEIQSITYQVGNETTTLTSTYEISLTDIKASSMQEYESAPDNQKFRIPSNLSDEIDIDKGNIIDNPSLSVGKEFFICLEYPIEYIIAKIERYDIRYVKYRSLSDGIIEINYYMAGENVTQKISPLSYKVTQFTD